MTNKYQDRMRQVAVFLGALYLTVTLGMNGAHAQTATDSTESASLKLENDSFAIPHSDTNYTMGVTYRRSTKANGNNWIDESPLARVLEASYDLWPVQALGKGFRTFILQDDAFTPTCLHTAAICASQGQPIDQDRPYANLIWVGASTKKELQWSREESTSEIREFDIGVYGTGIGRAVQTYIHERCCTEKIPQEWGTQIGDGGALSFEYKQSRINEYTPYGKAGVTFEVRYGVWAGWNTWPTAGLSGRYGPVTLELDTSYVLSHHPLRRATRINP